MRKINYISITICIKFHEVYQGETRDTPGATQKESKTVQKEHKKGIKRSIKTRIKKRIKEG